MQLSAAVAPARDLDRFGFDAFARTGQALHRGFGRRLPAEDRKSSRTPGALAVGCGAPVGQPLQATLDAPARIAPALRRGKMITDPFLQLGQRGTELLHL